MRRVGLLSGVLLFSFGCADLGGADSDGPADGTHTPTPGPDETPKDTPDPGETLYGAALSVGTGRYHTPATGAVTEVGSASGTFWDPRSFGDTTSSLGPVDSCWNPQTNPAPTFQLTYRDVGPSIDATGPTSLQLLRQFNGSMIYYAVDPTLASAVRVEPGSKYEFAWAGGASLGSGRIANVEVPQLPSISKPNMSSAVVFGDGDFVVSWAGSTSSYLWLGFTIGQTSILCRPEDDGSFVIPAITMSTVPNSPYGVFWMTRYLSREEKLSDGSLATVLGYATETVTASKP